ncbi:MAG: hypothetical protein GY772_02530 [bacterium]|nr:hypothetical protein [bacterium]
MANRTVERVNRETDQMLELLDELRAAAERLRATARVVVVLDELHRTRRSGDVACYASAAIEALSKL